jgi:hypothetical protein
MWDLNTLKRKNEEAARDQHKCCGACKLRKAVEERAAALDSKKPTTEKE